MSYFCLAEGNLPAGLRCLDDSECEVEHFCPYPPQAPRGDDPVCTRIECNDADDCLRGEGCIHFKCTPTLGESCSGTGFCARGQFCNSDTCDETPAGGGNACTDDTECAFPLPCRDDPLIGYKRCSNCTSDVDCVGGPAGERCNDGFCALCSAASCGEQQCEPTRGCVECLPDNENRQGTCDPGLECHDYRCRQSCDVAGDESCPSGYCAFSGYCSEEIGTPCPAESNDDEMACGGGVCLASVGGSSVAPFCTRTCHQLFDPPCPAGATCQGGSIDGSTAPYCVPN
jgi:hypothetical protein